MPEGFVTYLRVSTKYQEEFGLGLDAQRHAVEQYVGANQGRVLVEFVEVESGRKKDRPQLARAVNACRIYHATLLVARLDRLARNAAFLFTLRDSGVKFICADMPQANRFTIGIMAVVAEGETDALSLRIKASIAARRRRGDKIGNPENFHNPRTGIPNKANHSRRMAKAKQRALDLTPIIHEIRAAGAISQREIAAGLNARGIPAAEGGPWGAASVCTLLKRIGKPTVAEAMEVIREEICHQGGYRARNLKIYNAHVYRSRTFKSIAAEYGLSVERVRQLCHLELRRRRTKGGWPSRKRKKPAAHVELRAKLEKLLTEH